MKSANFRKITSTIVLFLLLVQAPLSAFAATDWTTPVNNPSTSVLSNLTNPQLLVSVLSCTGIVNKVVSAATDFVQNELNDLKTALANKLSKQLQEKAADEATANAEGIAAQSGGFSVFGVQISPAAFIIPASIALEQASGATGQEVYDDTAQKQAAAAAKKLAQEKCLNGIAVALARSELEKVTRSTLNWVGTGFGGDPLFVKNTDQFMNNITNKILSDETKWFADATNKNQYPYGQEWAISAINASRSQSNLDSSLSQNLTNYLTPGATPQSFAGDFSQGGWNGWLALTQNPANNPLGFDMVKSQDLANKQAEQVANTKAEITASGGYLNQKKCAVYALTETRATTKLANLQNAISTAQNNYLSASSALKDAQKNALVDTTGLQQLSIPGLQNNVNNASAALATAQANLQAANVTGNKDCAVWETVTPGSAIRDKITTTINSPETQLELVKTVDDALTYLFTALLSRFQTQGLSSLVTGSFDDVSGGISGSNDITDSYGNIVPNNNGSGGAGSGAFDITKDLAAVIQTQKDYAAEIAKAAPITQSVILSLGALDYCIPGPNPSWQANVSSDVSSNPQLPAYANEIDATFGPNSPMQDSTPGNTSYLAIAPIALNLTKNMSTTADTTSTTLAGYKQDATDAASNIYQLNIIKGKVDAIVAAARARSSKSCNEQ